MTYAPTPIEGQRRGTVAALVLGGVAAMAVFAPGEASRIGAVIAALATILGGARNPLGGSEWGVAALVGWAALSTFWAFDSIGSWESLKDYAGFAAIFIAVRLVVVTRRQLRIVLAGYLGGCAVALWLLVTQAAPTVGVGDERTTIEGVNANYLAYCFVVGVVIVCAFWAIKQPALLGRLAAIAFVVTVVFVGIDGTGTRAAELGLLMFIAWLLFAKVRPQTSLFIPAALALGGSAAIATGLMDEWFRDNLVRSARESGTLNGRLDAWPRARTEFWENPVIGIGADGFRYASAYGVAAHNVVLDLGVGLGLVGLGLFIWTLYAALIRDTAGLGAARGALVGGFLIAIAPILASGFWYQAPAFWVAVALFSRLPKGLATSKAVVVRGEPTALASALRRGQPRSQIRPRRDRQPVRVSNPRRR